jgi:ABC-type transport system involved in multi-copper enzyme maturation permease subunit
MLSALSAETFKLRRHKATWFLVWLFPIAYLIIFLIAFAVGIAGGDSKAQPEPLGEWIEDTILIWMVPANSFGRYLIAAFVAVVFAGEYGWNTWKLIVPHRSRSSLITAKYAAILILFAISFAITAVMMTIGMYVEDLASGDPIPAGITASVLLEAHGLAMLSAIPPLLLTIGIASLAAVLTRSMVAALVISLVAITLEQLVFAFGPLISIRYPAIAWPLFHVLPGYHLANISEWVREGTALSRPFPGGAVVALPLATSLAAAAAWIAATIGLTYAVFRRQDIN